MTSLNEKWALLLDRALPDEAQQKSLLVAVLFTLVSLVVTTKLFSGKPESGPVVASEDGAAPKRPLAVSYWLPFIGHTPAMAFDRYNFLGRLRDKYRKGVFSLHLMGSTHYIVHRPSLAFPVFSLGGHGPEDQVLSNSILNSTFGLPLSDFPMYNANFTRIRALYKHLLSDPGLGEITQCTLDHLKKNIPNYVTFNSWLSDQTEWERLAGAEVIEKATKKDETVVEVDLMELTRNFVGITTLPSLYGTDIVDNHPELWKWLWAFDDEFVLMTAGLPSWLPIPKLRRGKLARRKLAEIVKEWAGALDKHDAGEYPGPRWESIGNAGRLAKEMAAITREKGMSLEGRAAMDLGTIWTATANANPLITWMLVEIFRDAVLLEQIREEIAPYVKSRQPENSFGSAVWLSPELQDVDIEGLTTKCPLLKAAYVETLRVYTSGWVVKGIKEDTLLAERGKGGESFLLRAGSYAHVPAEMHQMDPEAYPDPHEWKVDRHMQEVVDENGEKTIKVEMGTIRPYSGGTHMCKGRIFANRELMLFTAVIITFYDIQPPAGVSWDFRETVVPVATKYPKRPIMAWVKRRAQPEAEKKEG